MDIKLLMNQYFDWIKQETTFVKINQYYEITTPFLDPINDCIQIYVKQIDNEIYFTDGGMTLHNIEICGVSLTNKRKQMLENIAAQFNVHISNNEIVAKCHINRFSEQKFMFIQAILSISDMYMLAQSHVKNLFYEDVENYFMKNKIFASKDIKVSGKSGYNHTYNYMISQSENHPERFCNIISNPNKSNIDSSLFAWIDTKEVRRESSEFILIMDDRKKEDSEHINDAIEACSKYDVKSITWTERNSKKSLSLLAS